MIMDILQIVDVCEEWQKEQKIARILEEIGCEQSAKILVFVKTKGSADYLTGLMRRDGWSAICIHGDKKKKGFKNGSTSILVTTHAAAGGLDVDNANFVITGVLRRNWQISV